MKSEEWIKARIEKLEEIQDDEDVDFRDNQLERAILEEILED